MLEVVFLWNPFFCYGKKIKQNWNLCFIAWWSKERRGHKKMLSMRQTKPMTMMNQNGRNRRNKCVSHFVYGNAPPTVRCRFFGLSTHGNIIFFCAFNETKCVRKWCRRESPSNKKKNNMTVCSLCGMLLFRMKKKRIHSRNWIICKCIEQRGQHSSCTKQKKKTYTIRYKSTYACSSYSRGIQCFACWMMLQ